MSQRNMLSWSGHGFHIRLFIIFQCIACCTSLHTATLCDSDQNAKLSCHRGDNSYIDITSIELLADCEVIGQAGCSLRIAKGSSLSDRCNWYNLRILEYCQGVRSRCILEYSTLANDEQANNVLYNPSCGSQLIKGFKIEYQCTNDVSIDLRSDYNSLQQSCGKTSSYNQLTAAEPISSASVENIILNHNMTRIEVLVSTTLPQPDISTLNFTVPVLTSQSTNITDPAQVQPVSIVLVTSILLATLVVLALVTITIVLICRSRRLKASTKKRNYPPIAPELGSEFDIIHGGCRSKFNQMFDKKNYGSSSRRNRTTDKSRDEICQLCVDRGHTVCQGHSLSRSSSFGSKDRKNLTFLIPRGYYEHVTVQTNPTATDAHFYSSLSDGLDMVSAVSSDGSDHYHHLSQATSSESVAKQEVVEGSYDIPNDYYEELPDSSNDKSGGDKSDERKDVVYSEITSVTQT